jgi:hypothetical protein
MPYFLDQRPDTQVSVAHNDKLDQIIELLAPISRFAAQLLAEQDAANAKAEAQKSPDLFGGEPSNAQDHAQN